MWNKSKLNCSEIAMVYFQNVLNFPISDILDPFLSKHSSASGSLQTSPMLITWHTQIYGHIGFQLRVQEVVYYFSEIFRFTNQVNMKFYLLNNNALFHGTVAKNCLPSLANDRLWRLFFAKHAGSIYDFSSTVRTRQIITMC